jgi:DNA-binding beta-propeller fold protein YncE
LILEGNIVLGPVAGRIAHLAVDLAHQRLFFAEPGNNSVGVVNLKARKLIHTIGGLREPQGVGYHPSTDTLYVANAGDGSVRVFRGSDFSESGRIDLNADADNIRLDAASDRIIVGYGSGALAVIDPGKRSKVNDIPLKASRKLPTRWQKPSSLRQCARRA